MKEWGCTIIVQTHKSLILQQSSGDQAKMETAEVSLLWMEFFLYFFKQLPLIKLTWLLYCFCSSPCGCIFFVVVIGWAHVSVPRVETLVFAVHRFGQNDLIWANISRTESPRGPKIQMRFQKNRRWIQRKPSVTKTLEPLKMKKRKKKNTRPAPPVLPPCVCVDSRPQGAPALCDDPRELGQPAGVHLQPLQRVVSAGTPGTVIEVVLKKAGLQRATESLHQTHC